MAFEIIREILERNLCAKCEYYHKENNTCHIKKVSTGGYGYVKLIDRVSCDFCKPTEERKEK